MNRVMPPSTGSSYTMSAQDRPVCGRAAGRFSTLTASAGREGTGDFGLRPERGHSGGGGGVVCPPLDPPGARPPADGPVPPLPPSAITAPTPPAIRTSRTNKPSVIRPRLVRLICGGSSSELSWSEGEDRAACYQRRR